jgi:sugar O-acyltransferase (sialic acid O-acetyltransferase NeuD family)
MSDRLVVFGSGGHAKVVVEAALATTPHREIVLLDDSDEAQGRSIFTMKVLGGRGRLDSLRGTAVALGIGDNQARWKLMQWLREQGHELETVIHPAAVVMASVTVGPGAFLSAGAIAIAEARIGAGAIINTGSSVDHDCIIGDAAHIAPGARLCGNVHVGDRSLIGAGSTVRPGISISVDAIIGAGSVVVRDIERPGTYVGNPARALRTR